MIQLGQRAKDKITGFSGVLTDRHSYLTGCDQYSITPPVNDEGEFCGLVSFDEGRIEILGPGPMQEAPPGTKPLTLGQQARDKVSGFAGILSARHSYLTGGDQYSLTPQVSEEGGFREIYRFDQERIEVTGRGILPAEVRPAADTRTGGPQPMAKPSK